MTTIGKNIFSTCEKCGKKIKGGDSFCWSCVTSSKTNDFKSQEEDVYNKICRICGERGRVIKTDSGRKTKVGTAIMDDITECFACYHNRINKKFYHKPSKEKTPFEKAYLQALDEYYLKPLFYGERPNLDALGCFGREHRSFVDEFNNLMQNGKVKDGYEYFKTKVGSLPFGKLLKKEWGIMLRLNV